MQAPVAVLFLHIDPELSSPWERKTGKYKNACRPAVGRDHLRAVINIDGFQRGRPGGLALAAARRQKTDAVDGIIHGRPVVQLNEKKQDRAVDINTFDLELYFSIAVA